MDTNFVVFRRFTNQEEAVALYGILATRGISSSMEDNSPPVDITFAGNSVTKVYEVLISPAHFPLAEALLEEEAKRSLNDVDPDHYLYSFTDKELFDLLATSDQWSTFDLLLAKKILSQRGHQLDESQLKALRDSRIQELAKPVEKQTKWIILGYVFSFAGGLIGIIIGYSLAASKKTLPDGSSVYTYAEGVRKHGRNIFLIGLAAFLLSLFLKIYQEI